LSELSPHSLLVCDHNTQELSMNNPKIMGPGIAPNSLQIIIWVPNANALLLYGTLLPKDVRLVVIFIKNLLPQFVTLKLLIKSACYSWKQEPERGIIISWTGRAGDCIWQKCTFDAPPWRQLPLHSWPSFFYILAKLYTSNWNKPRYVTMWIITQKFFYDTYVTWNFTAKDFDPLTKVSWDDVQPAWQGE
jgi:hypothetical protein